MRPAPSSRLPNSHQGFTLLEILVVIGIISILSTVMWFGSVKNVQKQKLQEAGAQMLRDLTSARNQAIRKNVGSTVTLQSANASSPATGYTINWVPPGSADSTPINQTFTLANGVKAAPYSTSSNTVTYSSPYAESSIPSGVVWQLSNPISGDLLYIKLLGVTGKGALSAQP